MKELERDFLHSLKQPLTIAHGRLSQLTRLFVESKAVDPAIVEKVSQAKASLDALNQMINSRQEILSSADADAKQGV